MIFHSYVSLPEGMCMAMKQWLHGGVKNIRGKEMAGITRYLSVTFSSCRQYGFGSNLLPQKNWMLRTDNDRIFSDVFTVDPLPHPPNLSKSQLAIPLRNLGWAACDPEEWSTRQTSTCPTRICRGSADGGDSTGWVFFKPGLVFFFPSGK